MPFYEVSYDDEDFEDGRSLADVTDPEQAAIEFCAIDEAEADEYPMLAGKNRIVKVREMISNTESGPVLRFNCSAEAIPTYYATSQ